MAIQVQLGAVPEVNATLSGVTIDLSGIDPSDATAQSADVLDGATFYAGDTSQKTGSIPKKQAETYAPSTQEQVIVAGQYLDGAQTIEAANLQNKTVNIAENGTVNVVADEGYYGLGSVGINVNVPGEIIHFQDTTGKIYVEHLEVPESITALDSSVYDITNSPSDGFKSVHAPGVTTINGHYAFGNTCSMEEIICEKAPPCDKYICYRGNLRTVQWGSIGYPATLIGANSFAQNSRSDLVITVYVDATTIADIVSSVKDNAPFGAWNATIVYRNSTTGEVITA